MQEEGEGPPRAVDLRGKEEGELREEEGVQDLLRGKEEGEVRTGCGRKEGCGIQKVGVGGGYYHVGSVGRLIAGDESRGRPQIQLRASSPSPAERTRAKKGSR